MNSIAKGRFDELINNRKYTHYFVRLPNDVEFFQLLVFKMHSVSDYSFYAFFLHIKNCRTIFAI